MAEPIIVELTEPVSLQTARSRLGIVSSHRDEEITDLIAAAREEVEDLSQTVLVLREVLEPVRSLSGSVLLKTWPIANVVRIDYVDADGNDQQIAGNSLRLGHRLRRPQTIEPRGAFVWPGDYSHAVAVLQAGFTGAGLDPYPPKLIQAILALVGCWFEDHEGVRPVPVQIRDLCYGFRRVFG